MHVSCVHSPTCWFQVRGSIYIYQHAILKRAFLHCFMFGRGASPCRTTFSSVMSASSFFFPVILLQQTTYRRRDIAFLLLASYFFSLHGS
ncbi:hypothetical protein BDV33DRAFT_165277 [Aspergillus novoparasiticus]|uniref:Uncharacterized protein n=1 Tax=Aspergillus novoparasiticus TaxID=986946 RepID=A0A5N6F4W9_9EURO|nr:hypothetical protein BDV33DRAFT_165277 [Aspergillus novoparasiticus]